MRKGTHTALARDIHLLTSTPEGLGHCLDPRWPRQAAFHQPEMGIQPQGPPETRMPGPWVIQGRSEGVQPSDISSPFGAGGELASLGLVFYAHTVASSKCRPRKK
jgi:hypothetical protein